MKLYENNARDVDESLSATATGNSASGKETIPYERVDHA